MNLNFKLLRVLYIFSLVVLLGIAGFGASILVLMNIDTTTAAGGSQSVISQITNKVSPIKTPVNVLLLAESGGNTDTMMVVHFNPVTCDIRIISVLRDTSVLYNNSYVKINSLYARGGIEAATSVVSKLLGLNIDYYVYVNTEMTRKIVDEIGGVYFDVPCRMKYTALSQNLHIDLQKGYQLLNGNQVEQLLRFRHPNAKPGHSLTVADYAECPQYLTSDIQRAITQQSFLVAFVKQKAKPEYLSKIASLMKIVFENIKTDFKFNTILRLTYNNQELSSDKITTYSINFTSGDYKYLGTIKDNTHDLSLSLDETNQIISLEFSSEGSLFKSTLAESASYRQQIMTGRRPNSIIINPSQSTPPTLNPNVTPKPTPKPTTKPISSSTPKPLITPAPPTSPPDETEPPTQKPDASTIPTA